MAKVTKISDGVVYIGKKRWKTCQGGRCKLGLGSKGW